MKIGSKEYNTKNERRHELIEKRVRQGLNEQEEAEYQVLQREILALTQDAFPRQVIIHPRSKP